MTKEEKNVDDDFWFCHQKMVDTIESCDNEGIKNPISLYSLMTVLMDAVYSTAPNEKEAEKLIKQAKNDAYAEFKREGAE
tara:strand:- start:223 stop:462 length:240 start_codon:yes stop_codon:yes gene_type:complete